VFVYWQERPRSDGEQTARLWLHLLQFLPANNTTSTFRIWITDQSRIDMCDSWWAGLLHARCSLAINNAARWQLLLAWPPTHVDIVWDYNADISAGYRWLVALHWRPDALSTIRMTVWGPHIHARTHTRIHAHISLSPQWVVITVVTVVTVVLLGWSVSARVAPMLRPGTCKRSCISTQQASNEICIACGRLVDHGAITLRSCRCSACMTVQEQLSAAEAVFIYLLLNLY